MLDSVSQRCARGDVIVVKISSNITIRGFTITDAGGQAIDIKGGGPKRHNDHIIIERNRIFGNGTSKCQGGIRVGAQTPDTVILNNLLYGNGQDAIRFLGGKGGPHYVVQNVIHSNRRNGVNVTKGQTVVLANNLITHNGTDPKPPKQLFGIRRPAPKKKSRSENAQLLNNLICGNTKGELFGRMLDGLDAGNLTPTGEEDQAAGNTSVAASPQCGDNAVVYANVTGPDGQPNTKDDDFTLLTNSPAVDAGIDPRLPSVDIPVAVASLEQDFFRDAARPAGMGFDIGAIEGPRAPAQCVPDTTQSCYEGPAGTQDVGLCRGGTKTCQADGTYGACQGQVLPQTEICDTLDNNCDGQVDEGGGCVVNQPPQITSTAILTAQVGQAYSYDVNATDPDAGDTLTFSLTTFPAGMTIDTNTGMITWTPGANQAGSQNVTVRVQDANGGFATQSFTIQVTVFNPNNMAPRAQANSYTIRADQTLTVPVSGVLGNDSDPENDPITARKLTDPTRGALSFNPDGSFSYVPSAANQTCTTPPPAAGISFVEPLGINVGSLGTGAIIRGLAKGDFNHDGFLDLAVTEQPGGPSGLAWRITLTLGKGDGTFQPPATLQAFAADVRPSGILARDVDGDCKLDLFVAVELAQQVLFFKGRGDGTFDPAVPTALTQSPFGLQSADVNGDGQLDLVTLNNQNSVSVLLGNGTGTFQSPVNYPAGTQLSDMALGDVNGDTAPDIVVSSFAIGNLSVLLNTNTGIGVFAAAQQYPVNMAVSSFYLADFNRDSKLDAVLGGALCQSTGSNPSGEPAIAVTGCMTFIPGAGDGTFSVPLTHPLNRSPFITEMANRANRGPYSENVAPDVNGDGILDVVFGGGEVVGNLLHVRLGNGDGAFTTTAWVASPGPAVGVQPLSVPFPDAAGATGAVVVDDFNGDGVMDIATAHAGGNSAGRVALLPGTTPGKFASPRIFPVLETPYTGGSFHGGNVLATYPMTLGDFNNDGQPELAVLAAFNRVGLMPFAADGSLGPVQTGIFVGSSQPNAQKILSADFDRDGNLDVVWTSGGSLTVAYGNGAGQFTNPVFILAPTGTAFFNIALGDFNNDGFPDVAAYTGSSSVPLAIDVYLSTGGGRSFTRVPGSPLAPIFTNATQGMVTADFDRDGVLDVVFSQGFHLTNQTVGVQQSMFLRGNGDGSFQPAVEIARGIQGGFVDYAAADVNHDDKLDLIGIAVFSAVHVQLGNGNGAFQAPVLYNAYHAGGFSSQGQVVLADFDWDGHLDVALTTSGTRLSVLRGNGDGTFGAAQKFAFGDFERTATSLLVADVNNDGRPDLIVGGRSFYAQDFTVLLNNSATLGACVYRDSFTYAASDGSLDSPPVTVRITIQPVNHPPVIVSAPVTSTNTGQLYSYDVNAIDPDAGERLAFGLVQGPSGMTLDPATGLIQWLPAANQSGAQTVKVRVYDSSGVFAEQTFTLTVTQRVTVPNVVGQAQAAAEAAIVGAGLTVGTITSRYSPTVPAGNVISQTPAAGLSVAQNTAVSLVVSLGLLVVPGLTSITVSPSNPVILVGGTQTFIATGVLNDGSTVDVSEGVTWSSGTTAVATINTFGVATGVAAGDSTITATLDTISGNTTLTVRARVTGDTTLPIAAITTPTDGAEVTSPIDVIGTASDANFFRYELSYALAGETNFTLLASGSTAVTNGVLGQFDPTLLINDLYDLKLTVFDLGGNQTEATVTVQVARELKVGLFTITFQDLNIPLSGIPITINRTYDSRDKDKGDFGIGWRLDIQTLRIRPNREQGSGWVVNHTGGAFGAFSLVRVGDHKVSLTLPGGKVEEFDMFVNPSVSPLFPLQTTTASYIPRPGTLGSLISRSDNDLLVIGDQPGNVTLTTFNGDTYNPKLFTYITADGTMIDIDRTKGVEKVCDPNGNTLTFDPTGIIHSSGKSVTFTRDAQGRITQITDPAGHTQSYAYNASGDLITHTDQTGNTTQFTYNSTHGLLQIIDPLNRPAIRNEYDANGRLIAQVDAAGNRVAYTHNLGAQEELITDPRGAIRRVLYDDQGNVTSDEQIVTVDGSPVNAVTMRTYDAQGNETSLIDPDGLRITSTYTGILPLSQVIDPMGINLGTAYAYNARNDVTSVTDPAGRVVSVNYDANGNITGVNTPFTGASTAVANTQGGVIQTQDAGGTRTVLTRDASGNVTREDILDAASILLRRTDSTYDANGNKLSETLHRTIDGSLTLLTTQFTYDAANRVTTITDPTGGITRIEYNAAGQETARINPLGQRTTFDYDAVGHRTRTTLPDGTSETSTYDTVGNLVAQSDRAGQTTTFEYDELNRQVKRTLPDGAVTRTIYTAGGRIAATIDAKGNRTDYTYDTAGRRTATTLPQVTNGVGGELVRPQISTVLNRGGTPDTAIDPNGRQTTYQYDASGRPTQITFADGSSVTQQFDALGRRVSITNEDGQPTTFSYDGLGRLKAASGLKGFATYTYDEAGNLLTQTDALGRVTQFRYDLLNRRIEKQYPSGEVERYAYDVVGNVTSVINANGQTTTFEYDTVNRPTRKTLPDASIITYSYTATDQRAAVTDTRGTTTYSYDALDRLASIAHPTGQTVSYSRDANGNLVSLNAPSAAVSYTYDALNRLTSVTAPEGQSQYAYDLAGNRMRLAAANGLLTDYTYDSRNRPTQLTHRTVGGMILQSFTNVFSPAGRWTKVTELDGSAEDYAYDSQGRLQSEVRTGTNPFTITHAYDGVGNRTQTVKDGTPTTFTYDVNDRLLSDGTATYTYDGNGNLTQQTAGAAITQYGYDSENRLTSFVDATGTTQFTYDADGNRVQSISPTGTTQFLVDTENNTGLTQVLEEQDGTGALQARYTYGTERLAMVRGGVARFYQHDVHGSVRSLTDSTMSLTDLRLQ
jgi:YD repeat-containing protein